MSGDPDASISVIITAYDCARYLGQAIDSVLAQTRPAQQIIIVDDGSTDDCEAVVRAYGAQVQLIQQTNRGPGAARNAGIRQARGEWLALLDGDDYWTTDKLAVQTSAAAANPDLQAIFGHAQEFLSPDLDSMEGAQLRVKAGPQPAYYASTLLIKRDAFARVGEFAEQLRISEFVDWYGRAMEADLRVELLPATLVWRRVHANNSTRRNRDSRPEYVRVLKSMLDRRRSSQRPDGT